MRADQLHRWSLQLAQMRWIWCITMGEVCAGARGQSYANKGWNSEHVKLCCVDNINSCNKLYFLLLLVQMSDTIYETAHSPGLGNLRGGNCYCSLCRIGVDLRVQYLLQYITKATKSLPASYRN